MKMARVGMKSRTFGILYLESWVEMAGRHMQLTTKPNPFILKSWQKDHVSLVTIKKHEIFTAEKSKL